MSGISTRAQTIPTQTLYELSYTIGIVWARVEIPLNPELFSQGYSANLLLHIPHGFILIQKNIITIKHQLGKVNVYALWN